MRLFYADPERPAPPTEDLQIPAGRSKQISGQVVFGRGWTAQTIGKNLGAILSRVSRAVAYTRWKTTRQ
jgi:hypothetical protein